MEHLAASYSENRRCQGVLSHYISSLDYDIWRCYSAQPLLCHRAVFIHSGIPIFCSVTEKLSNSTPLSPLKILTLSVNTVRLLFVLRERLLVSHQKSVCHQLRGQTINRLIERRTDRFINWSSWFAACPVGRALSDFTSVCLRVRSCVCSCVPNARVNACVTESNRPNPSVSPSVYLSRNWSRHSEMFRNKGKDWNYNWQ